METIKERLIVLMDALELKSMNAFDKALDLPRNSIMAYCGKGRNQKPGTEFYEKLIFKFPQVDVRWLITGTGSMFYPEKLRLDYIEGLEQKLATTNQEKVRLEVLADSLISRANFQLLSKKNAPVGKVVKLQNFYQKSA